jgi:ketosteroid isomerase-like protein
MPQDIAPLVRQAHDAFNRRDLDAFMGMCGPEFSFRASFEGVELGGYEGAEGIRRWWHDTDQAFVRIRLDVSGIEAHGDVALVHGRGSGLGRASGGEVGWPLAHVVRVRDGRLASWELFQTTAQAARAAGLAA